MRPHRSSAAQRHPDHAGEVGLAVGLGEQQHAGIETAVMDDGVLGVARGEQHLQRRPRLQRRVGELAAVHRRPA